MEDCIDLHLENDFSNYNSDTDEANTDVDSDKNTALEPNQVRKDQYMIHVNLLDVNNLNRGVLYSSTCVTSTPYLYCVAQIKYASGDVLLDTARQRSPNIGKLIQSRCIRIQYGILTQ